MSAFKAIVAQDIHNIFFETETRDEFTTTHIIDGTEYHNVVVDDLEQVERQKRLQQDTYKYGDGMWLKELMFYIPKSTYNKPLPTIGRAMMFDGVRYFVDEAIDEDGVYSISLSAKAN